MRGYFNIETVNPDGSIAYSERIPNIITASGLFRLGEYGLTDAQGISAAQFELFLGDRNTVNPIDYRCERWGHFTRPDDGLVTSMSPSGVIYRAKFRITSPPVPVGDVVGTWGCIGIGDEDDYLVVSESDIPGTTIGPAVRTNLNDTTNDPNTLGYGVVYASGLYIPPSGADAVLNNHHYPHMQYVVQITDTGSVEDETAKYVFWNRPYFWKDYENATPTSEPQIYQEGDAFSLNSATIDSQPNRFHIGAVYDDGGDAGIHLAPDHPSAPLYGSGYLYMTYEGNDSTEDQVGRIRRFRSHAGDFEDVSNPAETAVYRSALCDASGFVWVATENSGVRVYNSVTRAWSSQLPASGIAALALRASDNSVWGIDDRGNQLHQWFPGGSSPAATYNVNINPTQVSTYLRVYDSIMDFDSSGNILWVGTDGGGVWRIGMPNPISPSPRQISTASGLLDVNTWNIYVDHNNDCWVTFSSDSPGNVQRIRSTDNRIVTYNSGSGLISSATPNYEGVVGSRENKVISMVRSSFAANIYTDRFVHYYDAQRSRGLSAFLIEKDPPNFNSAFAIQSNVAYAGGYLYWVELVSGSAQFRRHPVPTFYGWNGSAWGIWDTTTFVPRVASSGYVELSRGVQAKFYDDPTAVDQFIDGTLYKIMAADGLVKSPLQTMNLSYTLYSGNVTFDVGDSASSIPGSPPYQEYLEAGLLSDFLAVDTDEPVSLLIDGSSATMVSASGAVDAAGKFWINQRNGRVLFNAADSGKSFEATRYTHVRRDG